ncbi:hypothetical protein [Lactiplantibacillus paraxiangfangensis]|uniref:hypothetical protein n=1 Tax=Lactiplantibacillus paraxiangfangensis TaxID=3076224 RepID=UPI0030C74517
MQTFKTDCFSIEYTGSMKLDGFYSFLGKMSIHEISSQFIPFIEKNSGKAVPVEFSDQKLYLIPGGFNFDNNGNIQFAFYTPEFLEQHPIGDQARDITAESIDYKNLLVATELQHQMIIKIIDKISAMDPDFKNDPTTLKYSQKYPVNLRHEVNDLNEYRKSVFGTDFLNIHLT